MKCEKFVVVHLITSLGEGGAEKNLFLSVKHTPKYQHVVWAVYGGHYVDMIDVLPNAKVFFGVFSLIQLIMFIRGRAAAFFLWMYYAQCMAPLIRLFRPTDKIIFLIRTSLPKVTASLPLKVACRLSRGTSRYADSFLACGERCGLEHLNYWGKSHYPVTVISNFSSPAYSPKRKFEDSLRKRLKNRFVIACVARNDPQKGHQILIEAIRLFVDKIDESVIVLCAGRNTQELSRVYSRIEIIGLGVGWNLKDIASVSDIHCSSSLDGEGFQNSILELLHYGCFSIATDIGEASNLVVDREFIVPPGSPSLLSEALQYYFRYRENDCVRKKWLKKKSTISNKYSDKSAIEGWTDFLETL